MPTPTSARFLTVALLLTLAASVSAKDAASVTPAADAGKKVSSSMDTTQSVRVGEATLVLPQLAGYVPAPADQLPAITQRIGTANRLLAFHIPRDADQVETARREASLGRSFLVQTLKQDEAKTMSEEDFKVFKSNLRKSFAALQDSRPEKPANAQKGTQRKGLPELQPGRPKALELFAGTDHSLAIMVATKQVSEVNGRRSEASQAIASAMVLLKGKMVTLSVYSRLESPADLEWVEKQTRAWVKQALAANR